MWICTEFVLLGFSLSSLYQMGDRVVSGGVVSSVKGEADKIYGSTDHSALA